MVQIVIIGRGRGEQRGKEEMFFLPEIVYCLETYQSQMTKIRFLKKGQTGMTALRKPTKPACVEFTQLHSPSFNLNTFLLCSCIEL